MIHPRHPQHPSISHPKIERINPSNLPSKPKKINPMKHRIKIPRISIFLFFKFYIIKIEYYLKNSIIL
jgi:hypothetical protein